MQQSVKSTICLCCMILLSMHAAQSQSDFEKYKQQQKAAFAEYKQQRQEDFKQYRDSINREFATFLEKEWKSFNLQKPEPLIKNPISKPPVYEAMAPKPKTEKLPQAKAPIISVLKPVPSIPAPEFVPVPERIPVPQKTVETVFFGTNISLKDIPFSAKHLSGITEKDIANYWKMLTNTPYLEIMNEAIRIKTGLKLNDWGLYQLSGKMFEVYFLDGTPNEQVIFTVFLLNQMGYQAKMGMSGNNLFPLIAFNNNITNSLSFSYGNNAKYYLVDPQHKMLSSIRACAIDYTGL